MGVTFKAKSVVLTAGTFLDGLMHIGRVKIGGGRISELRRTASLSNCAGLVSRWAE